VTPAINGLEAAGTAFTVHEYERGESLHDFGVEAAEKLGLEVKDDATEADVFAFFDAAPRAWGLAPDRAYPRRMIDLAHGRTRALAAYAEQRAGAGDLQETGMGSRV
jgi:hypothetical protein